MRFSAQLAITVLLVVVLTGQATAASTRLKALFDGARSTLQDTFFADSPGESTQISAQVPTGPTGVADADVSPVTPATSTLMCDRASSTPLVVHEPDGACVPVLDENLTQVAASPAGRRVRATGVLVKGLVGFVDEGGPCGLVAAAHLRMPRR